MYTHFHRIHDWIDRHRLATYAFTSFAPQQNTEQNSKKSTKKLFFLCFYFHTWQMANRNIGRFQNDWCLYQLNMCVCLSVYYLYGRYLLYIKSLYGIGFACWWNENVTSNVLNLSEKLFISTIGVYCKYIKINNLSGWYMRNYLQ